jgi:hypothetical protein
MGVDVVRVLQLHDNHEFMHHVRHFITNDLALQVISVCLHPLGIDLFQLETSFHRDILLMGNLYDIDGVQVRFIRYDFGKNRREQPYTRYG